MLRKKKSSVPPRSEYREQVLDILSFRRPVEPTVLVRTSSSVSENLRIKAARTVFSLAEVHLMDERGKKNAVIHGF